MRHVAAFGTTVVAILLVAQVSAAAPVRAPSEVAHEPALSAFQRQFDFALPKHVGQAAATGPLYADPGTVVTATLGYTTSHGTGHIRLWIVGHLVATP